MRIKQIRHQYIGPGRVEFYFEMKGCKVILLTAKFNNGNDIFKLYKLAQEALSALDMALLNMAA